MAKIGPVGFPGPLALGVLGVLLASPGVADSATAQEPPTIGAPAPPPGAPGAPAAADEDEGANEDGKESGDDDDLKLEVLTVTARRYEEAIDDVPQSLTALSGDDLDQAGTGDLLRASHRVPNLHVVGFHSRRLSFPFIRGIGSGQGDPAVVTYMDGVPQLTNSTGNPAFLDIERVEFLRGSQGALYGRNALGGVIHVLSRTPPPTLSARAAATVGDYGLQDYAGYVGSPLGVDWLRGSAAVRYGFRDGYTENDVTGNDIDSQRAFAARTQLAFTPSDDLEVRLIVFGERARDGGFDLFDLEALRDRPRHLRYDFEGETERDLLGGSLGVKARFGPIVVESTTGVQGVDVVESSDFDFSEFDLVRRTTPERLLQVTEEVRVGTDAEAPIELGSQLTLRWLVGALFFYQESDRGFANELRPDGVTFGVFPVAGTDRSESDGTDTGVAAYGQATLGIAERLFVTAGLRFDFEEKKARLENGFDVLGLGRGPDAVERVERDFQEWSPSVELAYRWTDGIMTWARAARGFKAGGFNARSPLGNTVFDPETSWTFEVGAKTRWLDDRVAIQAALFYTDWEDMQLTLFDPVIGGFVSNAGAATSFGAEVEVEAQACRWFDLYTGFGWTRARFDDFDDDPATGDADGNDLPLAPRFTWHGGFEARIGLPGDLELFARVEEVIIGRYDYDAANREDQRPYALTHARVGVRGEFWWVEGWMRNAFDEDYFPLAFQLGPGGSFVGTSGVPRTFGITAGVRF